MKPVTDAYRKAIFDALDGAVIYNLAAVPVVSAIAEQSGPFYIVLENVTTSQNSCKHRFETNATIQIEIVDYQTRTASYQAVNDIYALIMDILLPEPYKPGFSIDADFQAEVVEVVSEDEIYEQPFQKVVRKIFRLRSKIVENA